MYNLPENADLILSGIKMEESPFPHFSVSEVLNSGQAKELYNWFDTSDQWSFTKTNFYTQFEFSLMELDLPHALAFLNSENTFSFLTKQFYSIFQKKLKVVGITAHKLVDGHKMGVHNDFIGKAETHRLVVQINENWKEENGGYLMIFNSNDPQDVAKVIRPLHNSAIGFEISEKSFHAVSTVYDFTRYTLVYTFNEIN